MRETLQNRLQSAANCPFLFYSHFVDDETTSLPGTVTVKKFESDILYLHANGYHMTSVSSIIDALERGEALPSKSVCIAFVDGFESEYKLGYSILKKYGIHCDIFLSPKLMGECNGSLPKFALEQAKEMCSSGLVSIHGFVEDTFKNVPLKVYAKATLQQIKSDLGEEHGKAFINPDARKRSMDILSSLSTEGMRLQLVYYGQLNMAAILCGCFGHFSAEQNVPIQETVSMMNAARSKLLANLEFESQFKAYKERIKGQFLATAPQTVWLNALKNPILASRPKLAFPLSVLGVEDFEQYPDFFMSEFIPFSAMPGIEYLDFDNFDYKTWPMLETYHIGSSIIKSNDMNILSIIHKSLEEGYFVDTCIDAFFIPGKVYYSNTHIAHTMLITGYDADTQTFQVLTNVKSGKYTDLNVKLEDFLRSCSTNFFEGVTILKKKHWSSFYCNRETLRQHIQAYLYSEEHVNHSKWCKGFDGKKHCGVSADRWYLDILTQKEIRYDNLVAFAEHKTFLAWMATYVAAKYDFQLKDCTGELQTLKNAKRIVGLGVKSQLSHKTEDREFLKSKISDIITAEQTVLGSILEQLQK